MIRFNLILVTFIFLRFCLAIPFLVNNENKIKNYALLVAGSRYYSNYRHQADVAHANYLLRSRGYDNNFITTMMYNDVVNAKENPHQGKLFNKPNGTDVYKGISIQFMENEVSVENFLSMVKGNRIGAKSINVMPKDNLFIYLSGNGAPGIFMFPDEILTANKLSRALKKFSKKIKVILFVDAGNSGSLFLDHITSKNKNILAFSSSNETEPSFPYYWSDEMQTFLADHFSVNWMESVESMDPKKTTFLELFNVVLKLTDESSVLKFGDERMLNFSLDQVFLSKVKNIKSKIDSASLSSYPRVATHDIQLFTMIKRCEKKPNKRCLDDIDYIRQSIKKLDFIFNKLKIALDIFKKENNVLTYNSPYPDHIYSCYENSVKLFSKNCIDYNKVEKSFAYLGTFLQMCASGMDERRIAALIGKNC